VEPREIIIRPVLTEKSYRALEEGKYTFEVHPKANKIEIAKAVEKVFNVRVKSVNTVNVKSKPRRLGWHQGRTRVWKKAIVTLEPGQKIEFFEGM
jgi:large subunit ribosomal protein L23